MTLNIGESCATITRLIARRSALLAVSTGLFLGACDNKSDTEGNGPSAPNAETSKKPVAAIAQKPQAELAQMFASATQVLSSIKTPAEFAEIKLVSDVSLGVQGNALKINAMGSDPAVLLPTPRGDHAIAEIVIESPADTTLQVFYRVAGMSAFAESSSVRVPVKTGKNIVYVQLPAWIGGLRLDPGQVPGDYLLESIQIRRTP